MQSAAPTARTIKPADTKPSRTQRATHSVEDGMREHDLIKGARASRRRVAWTKDKFAVRVDPSAAAWTPGTDAERLIRLRSGFPGTRVAQHRTIKGGRLVVTKKTAGSHPRKRAGRRRDRKVPEA